MWLTAHADVYQGETSIDDAGYMYQQIGFCTSCFESVEAARPVAATAPAATEPQ